MKWSIIVDSSCDLKELETDNESIRFVTIPFAISVGNKEYIDNTNMNTDEMIAEMEQSKEQSHTSCPPPYAWYEQFEQTECSIAVTISSQLSGSFNSACTAKNLLLEKYPDKKIGIIDSRTAGAEIILIVRKIAALIQSENDFDTVMNVMNEYIQHTHSIFALSSFNNLINNGRMSKLSGFLAGKLGFWGIGIGSEQGTISFKEKVRGKQNALQAILNGIFEEGKDIDKIIISQCQNIEFAMKLKEEVYKIKQEIIVEIFETRGLCSYYAEKGGIIVGF